MLDNGPVQIVQPVSFSYIHLNMFILYAYYLLASCQHALCYNGGYCDTDEKGEEVCVCINDWQGPDCRASKIRYIGFIPIDT